MKKFYLVLVAMLLPFLANDLYGATSQRSKKTSTAKKKPGAKNTSGGKATAAKGARHAVVKLLLKLATLLQKRNLQRVEDLLERKVYQALMQR